MFPPALQKKIAFVNVRVTKAVPRVHKWSISVANLFDKH